MYGPSMMAQLWFSLAGSALIIVGTVITIRGAVRTWHYYRPNERLTEPLRVQLKSVRSRLRKLVGRPELVKKRSDDTARVSDTLDVSAIGLPHHNIPHEPGSAEFAQALEDNIREIRATLVGMASDQSTSDSRISGVKSEVEADRAERREVTKDLATGGVRGVLAGLWLTIFGISLQVVGAVIAAASSC